MAADGAGDHLAAGRPRRVRGLDRRSQHGPSDRRHAARPGPGDYDLALRRDGQNPAIANHVSGTTFIDMGRQLLKAIAHIYYEIPLDSRFVLHNVDIEFLRWAKLAVDIEVMVTVTAEGAAARRVDAPRTYGASLQWRQEGHLCARARSRFTTFSAALEAKLMTRQFNQGPVDGARDHADTVEGFAEQREVV